METIGGQAVIEGVIIRNKNKIATAVRTKKGIITKSETFISLTEKHSYLNIPIIRGTITFFEMLKIGLNSLNYSASLLEDENSAKEKKESNSGFYITASFSFMIAIVFFLFLPILITTKALSIEKTAFYFNIITGIIRIIFFIAYVYIISFMKDVRRLFMYHGAEHKVINCYENNEKVNLKNARKYSTVHKRCGTSFLLVMFIVAIVSFSFIDLAAFYIIGSTSMLIRTITHLLFLPLVLGIAYEIIKASSKNNSAILKIVTYPGALLQKITTSEPDDGMINVAIAALKKIV